MMTYGLNTSAQAAVPIASAHVIQVDAFNIHFGQHIYLQRTLEVGRSYVDILDCVASVQGSSELQQRSAHLLARLLDTPLAAASVE